MKVGTRTKLCFVPIGATVEVSGEQVIDVQPERRARKKAN